jgi:hypothetical protein
MRPGTSFITLRITLSQPDNLDEAPETDALPEP